MDWEPCWCNAKVMESYIQSSFIPVEQLLLNLVILFPPSGAMWLRPNLVLKTKCIDEGKFVIDRFPSFGT